MRFLRGAIAALVVLFGAAGAALFYLALSPAPPPATADLNDVARRLEAAWPDLASVPAHLRQRVVIVDANGTLLTPADPAGADPQDAGQKVDPLWLAGWSGATRPLLMPVQDRGQLVAWVFLDDSLPARHSTERLALAGSAAAALAAGALITAGSLASLHRRVIRPFQELEQFATRVAAGELSAPLERDRTGAFGAWSESFDLLRSELEDARRREATAREAQEALVAQIGHDLRTPVATISATAELLQLTEHRPEVLDRLGVLVAKSAQIDSLISDMFSAHARQIEALPVRPTAVTGQEVADLVRQADHRRLATVADFPAVLVSTDPQRLAQVLDNVIQNSYKYATTPLVVEAWLEEHALHVRLTDSGPGVSPDELGVIFARGQRGAGAAGTPGQGLGLFTCAQLMDRMGGHIYASLPADGGFAVTLTLPLA